ncbi:MAG: XisH family protein [Cyanobacteria bacterium P01_F01_bin.150]
MARDVIHDQVKNALVKDGWMITNDPYTLTYEEIEVYADLAAERTLAAEQNGQKIAVEIKSFSGRSPIQNLKEALGQYDIYRSFIELLEPDRKLYLAINDKVYAGLFSLKAIQMIRRRYEIALVVVKIETEEIVEWID